MAKVLIVYGTNEGQTAKIARFIGAVGRGEGHEVRVVHARSREAPDRIGEYDAILVGASVHQSRHQRYVYRWVRAHRRALEDAHAGFFQISLVSAIVEAASQRRASELAERMTAKTGWKPERVGLFAGALAYTQYRFLTRLAMLAIARLRKLDIDTSKDHEYTDWARVRAWSEEFFRAIADRPRAHP